MFATCWKDFHTRLVEGLVQPADPVYALSRGHMSCNLLPYLRDFGHMFRLGRVVDGLEKGHAVNAGLCSRWVLYPVWAPEHEVCLNRKVDGSTVSRGSHMKTAKSMSPSGLIASISTTCQDEVDL